MQMGQRSRHHMGFGSSLRWVQIGYRGYTGLRSRSLQAGPSEAYFMCAIYVGVPILPTRSLTLSHTHPRVRPSLARGARETRARVVLVLGWQVRSDMRPGEVSRLQVLHDRGNAVAR